MNCYTLITLAYKLHGTFTHIGLRRSTESAEHQHDLENENSNSKNFLKVCAVNLFKTFFVTPFYYPWSYVLINHPVWWTYACSATWQQLHQSPSLYWTYSHRVPIAELSVVPVHCYISDFGKLTRHASLKSFLSQNILLLYFSGLILSVEWAHHVVNSRCNCGSRGSSGCFLCSGDRRRVLSSWDEDDAKLENSPGLKARFMLYGSVFNGWDSPRWG